MLGIPQIVTQNNRMISEQQIGRDVKGSCQGASFGAVMEFIKALVRQSRERG
jgi:hypothetical protein